MRIHFRMQKVQVAIHRQLCGPQNVRVNIRVGRLMLRRIALLCQRILLLLECQLERTEW